MSDLGADMRALMRAAARTPTSAVIQNPRDLSLLRTLHEGIHGSHGQRVHWVVAQRPDRALVVVLKGAIFAAWFPYPSTTDGELDMLASLMAHTLRRSGWLLGCHRRMGDAASIGWTSFKSLVERSEWPEYLGGDWGWAWRISESGGPPYRHWGPPGEIADPRMRAEYDSMCELWTGLALQSYDEFHYMPPCPLDVARPFAVAGPDANPEDIRRAFWKAQQVTAESMRLEERVICAALAERVGRTDLVHWWLTGRLPAPPPRQMTECVTAFDEARRRGEEVEWVYVLREHDGDRIKIGVTEIADPMHRIRRHQTSSSQGRVLAVVAVLLGPRGLEGRMHDRFRKVLAPKKTEWFIERGELRKAVADRFVAVASELYVGVFHP